MNGVSSNPLQSPNWGRAVHEAGHAVSGISFERQIGPTGITAWNTDLAESPISAALQANDPHLHSVQAIAIWMAGAVAAHMEREAPNFGGSEHVPIEATALELLRVAPSIWLNDFYRINDEITTMADRGDTSTREEIIAEAIALLRGVLGNRVNWNRIRVIATNQINSSTQSLSPQAIHQIYANGAI